jgi:hypothetical protein
MRISRWMRLRLTSSVTAMRRLPKNGQIQVQLVEPPEQTQVLRALRPWPVIVGRARHAEQCALLLNTQVRMLWIDPSSSVFNR